MLGMNIQVSVCAFLEMASITVISQMYVCFWCHGAMAFSFTRFLDHTQRRTTVGRTPLDE